MKIVNETHWRTDHLRALIQRVAQDELDPAHRKTMKVYVKYLRKGATTLGWGRYGAFGDCLAYNGGWISLRLQRTPFKDTDKKMLAHTVAHEFAHTRGLKHYQMKENPRYMYLGNWADLYAWAADLPLEPKAVKVAQRPGDADKREKAAAMVLRWTRKAKAAGTRAKKWAKRVQYYDRKLAAQRKEQP